jgi:CheY-like chemotaxis protein
MGTELSGGRVLVVDDDRVNRMLLTRSLEREGPRRRTLGHHEPRGTASATSRYAGRLRRLQRSRRPTRLRRERSCWLLSSPCSTEVRGPRWAGPGVMVLWCEHQY